MALAPLTFYVVDAFGNVRPGPDVAVEIRALAADGGVGPGPVPAYDAEDGTATDNPATVDALGSVTLWLEPAVLVWRAVDPDGATPWQPVVGLGRAQVEGDGGGPASLFIQDSQPESTDPYVWFETSGGAVVTIWIGP